MTLKYNCTTDGTQIEKLKPYSNKKVIRICDSCKKETEMSWRYLFKNRNNHNDGKDYCFKCARCRDIYVSPLRMFTKINTAGYMLEWSDENNRHVLKHRLILANYLGKSVDELGVVHHINGDKLDNNINNLVECKTQHDHTTLHNQLENLTFEMVKQKIIYFDDKNKKYFIDPNIYLQTFKHSYGFENVAITQKKNICQSRLDVNIESEIIRGVNLKIPMIAANMSTVVDSDFCIKLSNLGALGVLHRAMSNENILSEIKTISQNCQWTAGSIGITNDQFDLCKDMITAGMNIVVIDVAHGYSDVVLELAKKIKKYNPYVKIVLGNTTNSDIMYECYEYVDAIKVGIAQGFACETKNTAGCTEKQFSAVYKFKQLSRQFGIPIISDGAIREPADFTKAIGAGANSIMAGKIFAECPESAAEIVEIDGAQKKLYAGMASKYVQEKWKGGLKEGTCAEGGVRYLDVGEPVDKMLERYSGALKSGITYAGGNDIKSFQDNVEFVILK